MKKVVAIHLLNDFSGSPLILSSVLQGFRSNGIEVDLFTNKGSDGFLSGLDVNYNLLVYRWYPNKWKRLISFLLFQFVLFFKLLQYRKQDVVIYINTLLPFGAAMAGKLMGKRVIYHCHETSLKPRLLKLFLKWVAEKTAAEAIYVSRFLYKKENLKNVTANVVYNSLSPTFINTAAKHYTQKVDDKPFIVLMLCSLKAYKGIWEFIKIAKTLPHLSFELVLNADMKSIHRFLDQTELSDNLVVFPVQKNVHLFYKRANLLLNLSHPDEWIETFGMTLLEAMHYGIPSIAPPVGGPSELVEDGVNGFQIDARNWEQIADKIKLLFQQPGLYQTLSNKSKEYAEKYTYINMINSILPLISK